MVVTGAGVVSCLGVGVEHVWAQVCAGRTGISAVAGEGFEQIPSKVAGLVPRGTELGQFHSGLVPKVEQRSVTTMTEYCLAATEEALSMAKWKPHDERGRLRTGVCLGTGMCPMEEIVDAGQQLRGGKYRRISPFYIPRLLINMAGAHVNLVYGFKGLNHSVSTACTTGLHAIGDASRFISYGDADVMVAGGTEASVTPLGMAGFSRMRALSTKFNLTPEKSSRPFDAERDGFVMADGSAVLVLEELEHAKARGATILAEVLGYGLSCDANHVTTPSDEGEGAMLCMDRALNNAGVNISQVGYINAHATSTPLGDAAESSAIQQLFGDASKQVLVSSTKGATGHLLGAAGSIEAMFTALACQTGHAPPTVNLDSPSTGFDLNYIQGGQSVSWGCDSVPRVAMTNSFGFGGTNASVVFSQFVG